MALPRTNSIRRKRLRREAAAGGGTPANAVTYSGEVVTYAAETVTYGEA